MRATELFITVMAILTIFNFIYCVANKNVVNTMVVGGITSLIATAIMLSVVAGIQVLGSGLNSASIKILFGVSALLQILFQIQFTIGTQNFSIGLGLINNVFNAFNSGDLFGIGLFVSTVFGVLALVSGLIVVIVSSEG